MNHGTTAWPADPVVCDKFHISENFTFRMTLNEAKREPAAGERRLQFSLDITRSGEVLFAAKADSNPDCPKKADSAGLRQYPGLTIGLLMPLRR